MNNKELTALVIALLMVGALAWSQPASNMRQGAREGFHTGIATVFNLTGTRIQPSSATETLTNSVNITGGMPITERPKSHSGGYLAIEFINKFLKILSDAINALLAFIGNSLSVSVNQSATSKESVSLPYLGVAIIFSAAVLIISLYYFLVMRKKSAGVMIGVNKIGMIQKPNISVSGGSDLIAEAINFLASKASKDLRKPPETITHRECQVVVQKVSKEKVKEEIKDLIRSYELSRFAGKPVNKDLRSLAQKVMNALKGGLK